MKIIISIFLAFSIANASMKIYKNKAELTYTPNSKFIGFNKNLTASSIDGDIKIFKGSCHDSNIDICKSINKLSVLNSNKETLIREKNVLKHLLDNFYSDYKSAKIDMDYITQASQSIKKIDEQINVNNIKIQNLKQTINLPVERPFYFNKVYKDKVKLNFSGISFYSKYILDIDKQKLQHALHIKNNSGVDIKKTTAYLFETNNHATTSNTAFRVSTVSKRNTTNIKKRYRDAMPMVSSMAVNVNYKSAPIIQKTQTRNFKIQNFSLKSDAIEKKFIVNSKKVKIKEQTIWRTWQNKVFIEGSFPIVDAIENKRIDIIYKNALIKNNFIRLDKNRQIFNIVQEYDIKVKSKKIPTYTESKGLFNSDTMTKTTKKLQVTNMSNKTKKLTIYSKIPVSTDEDIEVVLNYFKNSKNKNKNIKHNKKNGKLILQTQLKAKESKEFTYEYTIKHPKKIKVFIRN